MHRLPQGRGLDAVRNTQLAAACVTLGIPVTTNRKIHERTSEEFFTFTLGDSSVLPGISLNTTALINAWRNGSLEKADPCHGLLDALRGLQNRAALIAWTKSGLAQTLSLHADQRCPRTVYIPGKPRLPPPSSLILHPSSLPTETVETDDLAAVSALGICGIPVLQLGGDKRNTLFILARHGFSMHGAPACDAKQILTDFESGKLPGTHPFFAARSAILNYRVVLGTMKREMPMVYFEDKRGTGRFASIRLDAKTIAYDKARKWFNRS